MKSLADAWSVAESGRLKRLLGLGFAMTAILA
jgi:hypothetical protein